MTESSLSPREIATTTGFWFAPTREGFIYQDVRHVRVTTCRDLKGRVCPAWEVHYRDGGLRRAMKKEHITWRSWWDGGGTAGPIAGKWNVRGWPTVYLLDHKGVIRAKDPPEKELERIVDQLLKERIEEKIK